MSHVKIDTQFQPVIGNIYIPGDKSLTHRAILLSSIAQGTSYIFNWLNSNDIYATIQAVQELGTEIVISPQQIVITGTSWKNINRAINLRHAGTAIRLLAGIMVGQSFSSILDGSQQLRKRPMKRIIEPLQAMGGNITGTFGYAPLKIQPSSLHGITYHLPIPSAQVKSAILLASLFADGATTVTENILSRNHTEHLLEAMGANIQTSRLFGHGQQIQIIGPSRLQSCSFYIPGDFSSAAFLIVAATLIKDSDLILRNINLNPTRTGLLDALALMGANFQIIEQHTDSLELIGTLRIRFSELKGIVLPQEWVVRMIDEFPVFMVAALAAYGETIVTGANELRVKESDRLQVMTQELAKMGANIIEKPDGFHIIGPQNLHHAIIDSHDDHRIAMSLAIAGMIAHSKNSTQIINSDCTQDSFPEYFETLQKLGANISIE